ncbi:MAG: hypothetical protein ACT6QU_02670 [Aliihoeflea sp.]|uniref:hypothetical protein n=1 Tax=Aliihoeflea sp. TaxID=2608088 RepID=UPI004033F147
MLQVGNNHHADDNATMAAIHNRLDLLESQIATIERALVARDLMMKRTSRDDEPIIVPSVYPTPLVRAALPVRTAVDRAPIANDAVAVRANRWRSPFLAGAGMLAATLLAIEIIA